MEDAEFDARVDRLYESRRLWTGVYPFTHEYVGHVFLDHDGNYEEAAVALDRELQV